jgi:hypothetical protein
VPPDERAIHGHRVVITSDPAQADRVEIAVGERRVAARLDSEIGWSCAAVPFRGYASPQELAQVLAASYAAAEPEGEP